MGDSLLISDASTLHNFLVVRRFDLVAGLGYRVRIVDAVFEEIESERKQLEKLLADGALKKLTLDGTAITETVPKMLALGLGSGESFSFAAAIEFEGLVTIDDRRAIKRVRTIAPELQIITTPDIIVAGIRQARLTVAEADSLKADWADNHKFRLKLQSFAELVGEEE